MKGAWPSGFIPIVMGCLAFFSPHQVWSAEIPAASVFHHPFFGDLREALRNVGASFDSRMYGPSITEWKALQPDPKTGRMNGYVVTTDNKFNLFYRLPEECSVGVTAWFYLDPVYGHAWTWDDPSIFVKKRNLIHAGNYRLNGGFRLMPALGAYSANKKFSARLEQDSSYSIEGTRFRISFYGYYWRYFLNEAGFRKHSRDVLLFFIPGVDYRASDKLTLTLSYKGWAAHGNSKPSMDYSIYQAQVGPSFTWSPTPDFSFGLGVDASVAPGDKTTLRTTVIGYAMNWRLR